MREPIRAFESSKSVEKQEKIVGKDFEYLVSIFFQIWEIY